MIKPLALYIGLRYTRAKRRNHFISFISLASMLGIALGVLVLITVLSVMNGFDYQIRSRFFAIAPEVTVVGNESLKSSLPDLTKKIQALPDVAGVAPYVSGNGLFASSGQINGIQVVGINPSEESKISKLGRDIVTGNLNNLKAGQYHIVLGQSMANRLGLRLGDKINLFTPQMNVTLAGIFPRYRQFTVTGIFQSSSGFGFEDTIAFIHIEDAAKLFSSGAGLSGLHIRLKNLYQAEKVSLQIQNLLPPVFSVTNWTIQFGAFFQALVMEKTMLFIILLLIVAVATFNLVSTLVMVVNDKRADIAILRTIGASPATIMATFIVQGAVVGLVGTVLGLIGGIILAWNVTALTNGIQNLFHVHLITSSVFFIDYLPSRIEVGDIIKIAVASFVLSLLATIYPALLAFKTQPAEALRYE